MNNNFFRTTLPLLILTIIAFGLSACSSEVASNTQNAGPAQAESPKAHRSSKNSANYPPLAEGISQAEMEHLDGTRSKVADKKGKVLLLNMWATWCGPCRAEMPHLIKIQDKYRDQDFEIIGLNTDDGDTKEMIEEFAAEMKLNYTLVWANTAMQEALLKTSKFDGIPQSFVVDRDGHLRGVFRGADPRELKKLEETIDQVVVE